MNFINFNAFTLRIIFLISKLRELLTIFATIFKRTFIITKRKMNLYPLKFKPSSKTLFGEAMKYLSSRELVLYRMG